MTTGTLHERLLGWYVGGERGSSSEALAAALVEPPRKPYSYPGDPADLRRCLLLIKAVPEAKGAIDVLALYSEQWTRLAAVWDELERQLIAEIGYDLPCRGQAPKTYTMMRAALDD